MLQQTNLPRSPFRYLALLLAFFLTSLACITQLNSPEATSLPQNDNPATQSAGSNPAAITAQSQNPTLKATPVRQTNKSYSATDLPDDTNGYQIHFIYALPSDGKDGFLDVDGEIALSANALNNWLLSHTDHHLRFDTYQGNLDISFLQLDYTADQISKLGTDVLTLMEYEIKTRGFDTSHKLFVVHYDGFFVSSEGYCGLAQYPPEGVGVTAVLLLRGYNPRLDLTCPRQFTKSADYTGYFEMTILHELLHLMGMVPSCAPHFQDGHVSDSMQDLMYYKYDGSYSPLYTYLDFHHDDYYEHGNPNCPDFARSAFLEPLPENSELPPGWDLSSTYIPSNPLLPNP